MKISGSIEEIIYKNTENGYTVLNIDCDGELVTCVGKSANLNEGEFVELAGSYTKNAKFGEQFAFDSIKISQPQSLESILRYLSSGLIKGIGPVTAQAIVDKFGKDTLKIIEYTPERLSEVKGVSKNKASAISEAFIEIKTMQNAVMFLQNFGITTNMAVKIFNIYGQKTVDLISKNPYRLVEDVDGIGFLTADRIAANMGVSAVSEFRMRAGILHVLKEASDKGGNTYLPKGELCGGVLNLLKLEVESGSILFENVVQILAIDNAIKQFDSKGRPVVMLTKFYNMENGIAKKLNLLNIITEDNDFDVEKEIADFERINNITLHADQKRAVECAVSSQVSVITGGPGTGKTTIVKAILKILNQFGKKIYLLAPTGRAAKRLSQSCERDASTIHRALEVNFKDDSNNFFNFNEKNKLPADVVIVDEMSMVDVPLFYYLLRALPNTCRLILVGDKDQLPSVGPGNVLHDILKSEAAPAVILTQIYRQDEKSLIVTNAHLINNGNMPDLSNKSTDFFFEEKQEPDMVLNTILDLVMHRLPKYIKLEPKNIQVLAPMKSGVTGVERLNKELQALINPQSLKKQEITLEHNIYREGDKVMQMVNNYNQKWISTVNAEEGEGVFNGDMGEIKHIDFQTGELTVEFDDDKTAVYPRNEIFNLSVCYATTIHKSQGSEFDVVVMPIMAGSNLIITRNLLYTAVTRAKKLVVIVGSRKNISRMIYNNHIANRYTMLTEFLKTNKKKIDILYN